MEQMAIVEKLVQQAKQQGKVKTVYIEVGELADITAQELTDALKSLVDWNVVIQEKKAVVRCSCGFKGEPKIVERRNNMVFFVCPKCSSLPKVLSGKDIVISKVEVEQ